MTDDHHQVHDFRLRAVVFLLGNVVFWSFGPLFVKYFSRHYDVWTQNAFRYSLAAVLLVVALAVVRPRAFRLGRAQWAKLLLVAGVNTGMQAIYASIFYFIYPSVAALVIRADVIFMCILAWLLFRDERHVIRTPRYLIGVCLTIAGIVTVVFNQDPALLERLEVGRADFWIGIGLVLAFAFFLALYGLSIKRLVRDVNPVISFTHVSWITALALSALALLFGHPTDLIHQGAPPVVWMVVSAILCIALAHPALYAALREIKAVVVTALMQLTPVLTCILSAAVYGDRLTGIQIIGGATVLAGAWLTSTAQAQAARRARRRATPSAVPQETAT